MADLLGWRCLINGRTGNGEALSHECGKELAPSLVWLQDEGVPLYAAYVPGRA